MGNDVENFDKKEGLGYVCKGFDNATLARIEDSIERNANIQRELDEKDKRIEGHVHPSGFFYYASMGIRRFYLSVTRRF